MGWTYERNGGHKECIKGFRGKLLGRPRRK